MNPPRLVTSARPEVRALLKAARGERPRASTEATILRALALGPMVAPSAVAQFGAWFKHAASGKVGVVVLAFAAAATGFVAGQRHERLAQVVAPVALSQPLPQASPIATPTRIASASLPRAEAPRHSRLAPTAPLPAVTEPAAPASLSDEIEALQRTHRALNSGDGATALVELDVYSDTHPHGALEEEALGLRVQALRLLDNRLGATRVLRELAERFPNSIYLGALREAAVQSR